MVLSSASIYIQKRALNKRLVGVWKPKITNNQAIDVDQLANIELEPKGKLTIGELEGSWKYKGENINLYDQDEFILGEATMIKEDNKWMLVVSLEVDGGDGTEYIYGR